MQRKSDQRDRESPEKLITGLMGRLRNHVLWDSLSVFLPPVLVSIYLAAYLYHAAWITQTTFLLSSFAAAGLLLIGVSMRRRPFTPSVRSAARLVDERTGAKDRFITLATVEPSACSPLLFRRVRQEAAEFGDRIDLKREFPYKVKRSFYQSLVISVFVGILLHLFLPSVQSSIHPVSVPERLRDLARKMMQRPRLAAIARDLQKVATKLEEPRSSQGEKQATVEETRKRIDEQNRKQQEQEDRELLGQASSTLKGLDQQSGQDTQKDQNKGDGGIQSQLPQEGQGEAKQSQGGSGENKGDLSAQLNKQTQQGKSAPGDPKEQGSERNQQNKGDEKGKQADSNKPDGNESKETAGKTQRKSGETGGKDKASEETPRGAPPAERFYQAGEKGKEGIKDARYVTVQLPEEIGADSKGNPTSVRKARESKDRPKVPVSNVPLPAHIPDAPTETQRMPLEYRGLIR
jgi:hypothetical protein